MAGQRVESTGRHAGEIKLAHAERSHLVQSRKRLEHPLSAHAGGGTTKALERRGAFVLRNREQSLELHALLGAGRSAQDLPESCRGTLPDPGDEASERGYAGEQDLVIHEPGGGMVEENARSLGAHRRASVEPPHEAKDLTGFAELAVAIAFPDLVDMAPSGLILVVPNAARIRDTELAGEVCKGATGNLGGLGEEGAEEAHGPQLGGEPELVVVAMATRDALSIGLVEMKVLGELLRRGFAGEAAIALRLRRGEEVDGHEKRTLEEQEITR